MKAYIFKTSDDSFEKGQIKEFKTVEELMAFQEEMAWPIILSPPYGTNEKVDFQIEVYDDYRE